MLRLSAWGSAWLEFRLKGKGRRPAVRFRNAKRDHESHGFGSCEPVYWAVRRFYAVYGERGRFIFQAGRRYWDLTDGPIALRFTPVGLGMASVISVYRGDDLIHRASLIHPGKTVWPRINPTYDYLDAEADHFFLFLQNEIHKDEWRQRIIDMAATAI